MLSLKTYIRVSRIPHCYHIIFIICALPVIRGRKAKINYQNCPLGLFGRRRNDYIIPATSGLSADQIAVLAKPQNRFAGSLRSLAGTEVFQRNPSQMSKNRHMDGDPSLIPSLQVCFSKFDDLAKSSVVLILFSST